MGACTHTAATQDSSLWPYSSPWAYSFTHRSGTLPYGAVYESYCSPYSGRVLPATLPCGARTFLCMRPATEVEVEPARSGCLVSFALDSTARTRNGSLAAGRRVVAVRAEPVNSVVSTAHFGVTARGLQYRL